MRYPGRAENANPAGYKAATAEGVEAVTMAEEPRQATWSNRHDFAQLWNGINEKRGFGWNANPWVWVIEFKMVSNG